jgi:hypothetical protein
MFKYYLEPLQAGAWRISPEVAAEGSFGLKHGNESGKLSVLGILSI